MSRNLGRNDCYFCEGPIALEEAPRVITADEAGVHFTEYAGMRVANGACVHCAAQYLAWLDEAPPERLREAHAFDDTTVRDLSFRSTFDNEPDDEDMPRFRLVDIRYRVPITVSRGALADLLGGLRRAHPLDEVRVAHDDRAEGCRERRREAEAYWRARDPKRS